MKINNNTLMLIFIGTLNAFVQRQLLRSEAEKKLSGGGPFGPEQTGTTC